MIKALKCLLLIATCALAIFLIVNIDPYSDAFITNIMMSSHLNIQDGNKYEIKENFDFVSEVDEYTPYSYNDLLNIIYTAINKGWDRFTFYCASEYSECINDITKISDDETLLTHINNFVHPFNSFTNLKTIVASTGEITIEINYLYNAEQIAKIENKVDQIIKDQINTYDSPSTKIKAIHDYIVSNTQYDVERNTTGDSNYLSYLAYGPLFDGYATCSGYTDLMAIFLDKFGIKNYKVATTADRISNSNNGHIWNAVYLDGEWLHLDLTWDDPVSDGDVNYITHSYFLISTEKLIILDEGLVKVEDHNFDRSVYTELK
jgi:hypothetical protein